MQTTVSRKLFGDLAELLLTDISLKRATKFLSKNLVVSAQVKTYKPDKRRGRRDKRNSREEIIFKVGAPNYLERQFIKDCIKAGQKLPVSKVQLKRL